MEEIKDAAIFIYGIKVSLPTPDKELEGVAERSIREAEVLVQQLTKYQEQETNEHIKFIEELIALYKVEETKRIAIDRYLDRFDVTEQEAIAFLQNTQSIGNEYIYMGPAIRPIGDTTIPPPLGDTLSPGVRITYADGSTPTIMPTVRENINGR